MIDLKGKWVLITGASRGIGRLTARFMAERGCNLVLHSRERGHCDAVLEEVRALGVQAYAVEAELKDLEAVDRMLAEIDKAGTQIDVILNNAGMQVPYRDEFLETPMDDYRTSFLVNTMAPMKICYHFLPGMAERGFGRIVNTTSGIDKDPQQAGYSASKAALDKVTRDLATKYEGTNVQINLTDPGWCRTDLGSEMAPNAHESALPGVVVGAFVSDGRSGRLFPAQAFSLLSLEEAVSLAQTYPNPYGF